MEGRYALIIRDMYTGIIMAYPTARRDTDSVVRAIKHFCGRRKIKQVYSDDGPELINACVERPKQRRWNGVDDPISHCLAGNSLPGTGKTHLARTILARLREQGERCAWCPRRTAPRRTWGWVGISRSWTWRSGRTEPRPIAAWTTAE